MRTPWLQCVGCLALVALGVNSVSAGVRAKPDRYRELEARVAQADTRNEVVPPRAREKSVVGGESLIPPSPPPEPGPPVPRYEQPVPHHPPHMGDPPEVFLGSHSRGGCAPAPQACGCSGSMNTSGYGNGGVYDNGGGLHPAYSTAFPNGYYRSGAEAGMHHFPYYSYRRPWYYPGQPSFHRDTDLVW